METWRDHLSLAERSKVRLSYKQQLSKIDQVQQEIETLRLGIAAAERKAREVALREGTALLEDGRPDLYDFGKMQIEANAEFRKLHQLFSYLFSQVSQSRVALIEAYGGIEIATDY